MSHLDSEGKPCECNIPDVIAAQQAAVDEERRNAISAMGEDNLQALRDLAGKAADRFEAVGEAVFHAANGGTAVHDGYAEDCSVCKVVAQFKGTLAERDAEIAAGNQGQYYAVSARHGDLISRKDRPVYATLAEWASLDGALPTAAYIPTTVTTTAKSHGPLFGSLPLFDTHDAPDVVGRVIEVLGFLERGASALGQRVEQLDQQLINGRLHERELLARAANMIDPDHRGTLEDTTEERLDWLAKWREVTTRG